ncbi:YceI family protein [Pontibacter sp. HJ8]
MSKRRYSSYYRVMGCLLLVALYACETTVVSDVAEVGAAVQSQHPGTPDQVFRIDTAKSTMTWIGAKVTGRHNGIFRISQGEIDLQNGLVRGGTTVLDMTALRSDDKKLDEAGNEKLTKHLRSADFFDVEQHPTATFELTSVVPYDSTAKQEVPATVFNTDELRIKHPTHKVTGNLTIKGITKSISFPARIALEDSVLKAKANFNLNRTDWKLTYGADKSMGNKTIHPQVNVGFDLIARQQ